MAASVQTTNIVSSPTNNSHVSTSFVPTTNIVSSPTNNGHALTGFVPTTNIVSSPTNNSHALTSFDAAAGVDPVSSQPAEIAARSSMASGTFVLPSTVRQVGPTVAVGQSQHPADITEAIAAGSASVGAAALCIRDCSSIPVSGPSTVVNGATQQVVVVESQTQRIEELKKRPLGTMPTVFSPHHSSAQTAVGSMAATAIFPEKSNFCEDPMKQAVNNVSCGMGEISSRGQEERPQAGSTVLAYGPAASVGVNTVLTKPATVIAQGAYPQTSYRVQPVVTRDVQPTTLMRSSSLQGQPHINTVVSMAALHNGFSPSQLPPTTSALQAAIDSRRVYAPQNSVYVPGYIVARSGLQTTYDSNVVPTFESDLVFALSKPVVTARGESESSRPLIIAHTKKSACC